MTKNMSSRSGSQNPMAVDCQARWQDDQRAEQTATCRILDAAANRAREGLRVVEDFIRFTLDDAHLTEELKKFRHKLSGLLKTIEPSVLLNARDTQADVGTDVSTPAEAARESLVDVARTNFKRVQEALRTLEEYSKRLTTTPDLFFTDLSSSARVSLPEQFGQLRYQLYTLEKAVLLTYRNCKRLDGCQLYLVATSSLCRVGFDRVVLDALAAGVDMIQLREKAMPDRQIVAIGRQVRTWSREADVLFIMNDRPDLSVLCEADGVHVGQDELTVHEVRRIIGPDRLVGLSTHTIEQARQAVLDGADYIGVGPVFESTTKTFDRLAGAELVRQVAAEITLPWFAIGGIDAENIGTVLKAGATRVAVSSALCAASDPKEATRQLARMMSVGLAKLA